ncbi:hypothetical protein [Croceibacterium mercuriale]|uniref:hypothetical protein n=1 Tax=Croceibacterium mercuriale TaxID=1572751 RepID=UPI000689FA01|nr:hypothetical protein [Croceibacterium mercuriale]
MTEQGRGDYVWIEQAVPNTTSPVIETFEVPAALAPPQELAPQLRLPTEQAFTMVPHGDGMIAAPVLPEDALPGCEDHRARRAAGRRTSYVTNPGPMPEADDPLLDFVPAPHTHPRRNSITAERQREFIAALAATGVVLQAAAHIGASPEALYNLRHKPGADDFAAAWEAAAERGFARVEDSAVQRAITGENRLIVSGGKLLGYERRHNEALVMFLLRNRRPERYGGSGRSPKLPPLRQARHVPARDPAPAPALSQEEPPALPAGDAEAAAPGDLRGWKRMLLEQPHSVDLRRFTGFELEALEQMTAAEAYAPDPVPHRLVADHASGNGASAEPSLGG